MYIYVQGILQSDQQTLRVNSRHEGKHWMGNHRAQTSSVGPKHETIIKSGKKNIDSFSVFAKIILYLIIFFKNIFKCDAEKMSIVGASDFRVTDNNYLP